MTVNTKTVADRRAVSYACLDCLAKDLDAIEAAHGAGTLSVVGNWTPGQIVQHCAGLMRCALDGFPGKGPPAPLRWFFTLLFKKKAVGGHPPPAGFKIPAAAAFLLPDDDVPFEKGMGEMREMLARVEKGDRFTHRSPIFGKLTHEQWIKLNLGHCQLHFSFLKLGDG